MRPFQIEVCVFCAERNLSRLSLCKSDGSCPAVLEQFTWLSHSPSPCLLVLTNACGWVPPPPASQSPPVEMSCRCSCVLAGVHMEHISRKRYANQFQKRGKHRKMMLMVSLKQIKSISYGIPLPFKKGEAIIIAAVCAITDWHCVFVANTEQLICCRSQDFITRPWKTGFTWMWNKKRSADVGTH